MVVLVLFGTILYGAYSVVQKGSTPSVGALPDAPPFAPPVVELASAPSAAPATPPPITTATPTPVVSTAAAAATPSVSPSATVASPQIASPPVALPTPVQAPAPTQAQTTPAVTSPTYLMAESAPPPGQDVVAMPSQSPSPPGADRPERLATLPTSPAVPVTLAPVATHSAPSSTATSSSAAFAAAWTDAHVKLAAGRYAEALAALSIWYDDSSLGLEESQRLEDLLGQLAGTVIYSSHDHLLPPHVVAAGETLPTIAMTLGVPWQLLGKINGITDPQGLIPGEHLKVVRGPFDAVVSVSRRRLSLQLAGNYAGSFPVVIGRDLVSRVGRSIAVTELRPESAADPRAAPTVQADAIRRPGIVLSDGLLIEPVDDPSLMSENTPSTSLLISRREFADIVDILGPGSRVLVRQ